MPWPLVIRSHYLFPLMKQTHKVSVETWVLDAIHHITFAMNGLAIIIHFVWFLCEICLVMYQSLHS